MDVCHVVFVQQAMSTGCLEKSNCLNRFGQCTCSHRAMLALPRSMNNAFEILSVITEQLVQTSESKLL